MTTNQNHQPATTQSNGGVKSNQGIYVIEAITPEGGCLYGASALGFHSLHPQHPTNYFSREDAEADLKELEKLYPNYRFSILEF